MSSETTHRATRVGSRRVLGDVGIQLAGQIVNVALGIVTTVVLVRALEATRYGEWATIMAVIDLVAMVGNFGLETVAIRLAAQEPEREGAWVGAATTLRLAIALPALLVFVAVLAVVAADEEMLLAGLILSLLYVTSVLSTLRIVFRLHVRNHVTVFFTTLNSVLWA
ncbi:MAG TPA: oligosaccharide flippase family protein, partial [Solirubrobacterales bacterium]